MIALKILMTIAGISLMAAAVAFPLYGLWLRLRYRQRKSLGDESAPEPEPMKWRGSVALALVACLPLLVAHGQADHQSRGELALFLGARDQHQWPPHSGAPRQTARRL